MEIETMETRDLLPSNLYRADHKLHNNIIIMYSAITTYIA